MTDPATKSLTSAAPTAQVARRKKVSHLLSWCAGLLGLVVVTWYFQPVKFASQLEKVGVTGALLWLLLTLGARLCLVETIVLPIRALGFSFQRSDAFWLGWVRTFANQIVPLSGLAIYAREIRRKTNIPWSGIVALSTPTFLLAATVLSFIGLCAIASNVNYVGPSTLPMMLAFTAVGCASLFAATNAGWIIDRVPLATLLFPHRSAEAFRRLAKRRRLITALLVLHGLAILVRGTRIWILFVFLGAEMGLPAALLIIVVAESAALFQITPGGLGLREGAIVGGSIILHMSPELGATVALIDRLFMVAITTLMAIPGYALIRR